MQSFLNRLDYDKISNKILPISPNLAKMLARSCQDLSKYFPRSLKDLDIRTISALAKPHEVSARSWQDLSKILLRSEYFVVMVSHQPTPLQRHFEIIREESDKTKLTNIL